MLRGGYRYDSAFMTNILADPAGRSGLIRCIRGEGSSSPSARLIIVRRRRQSQHEAGCDTDGQQQREAEHHLEHEFPNLKTCHPDVQTEEDRRAGYFGSGPSTLAERPGDHGPICDCSPEQLGPTVL